MSQGALFFVVASSCLVVHRQLNILFDRALLGHDAHQDLGEEDEVEEEGDMEQTDRLRRVGSEFSLGLNRVKSVDDMIKDFEWEFCSTGQRALHAIRISGYVLIGSLLIARITRS